MKKGFLFLLFSVGAVIAQAGRQSDLALRLVSPQNNTNTPAGSMVTVTLQAKNAGGDPILSTDTIRIRLFLDGYAVPFYDPITGITDTFTRLSGFGLAPGDSAVIFNRSFAINDSGSHTFCFESSLVGAAATGSVNDPNNANNRSCAQVFFGTVGLTAVEKQDAQFEVYPVPAGNTLNWKAANTFHTGSMALYNVAGVCVQQTAIAAGNTSLDISQLPAGLYLLRATAQDGQVLNRRFIKQ